MKGDNLFSILRRLLIRLLVFSARPLPDDRDAIWSIPRAFQIVYFMVFIGICIPMIMDIVQDTRAAHPGVGWIPLARESASEFAAVGVGAAIGSLIAVQGVAIVMSLYHIITNRFTTPIIEKHREEGRTEGREEGRTEGRVEGRTEGRSETNEAWREWNRRRMDAESQGAPFDEPPPDERE